uniref:NADH-ubiquinone oxidoreductase chain 3 n=1 Tax=Nymphon unguiculatum-charcoti complex sp. SEM-1997 TaxID=61899 RepID=E0XLH2_9CHEL|nr:NADH dehydrogenase subunit 3 [Nymphon unguiculatum-charcoti complex sp. SEM-1997]
MIYMFIFMVLIVFLVVIMMMINIFLSKKMEGELEKSSPVECGMDPFSTIMIPFSLQFFLITIIFIIFDIEVAMIIPFPISNSSKSIYMFGMVLFLFILLIGFYHEWKKGALNWNK